MKVLWVLFLCSVYAQDLLPMVNYAEHNGDSNRCCDPALTWHNGNIYFTHANNGDPSWFATIGNSRTCPVTDLEVVPNGPFGPCCWSCEYGWFGDTAATEGCYDATTNPMPGKCACPDGTEDTSTAGTNGVCRTCPQGYIQYTSSNGHAYCDTCWKDFYKYQDEVGQTTCKVCGDGESSFDYAALLSDPTWLNSSNPFPLPDRHRMHSCKPCPIGMYQDKYVFVEAPGWRRCEECPLGQYQDETPVTYIDKSTTSAYGGAGRVCKVCPSGMFGPTRPVPVRVAWVQGATSAASCQNCPAGYVGEEVWKRHGCSVCRPGEYSLAGQVRVSSYTGYHCTSCPSGLFAASNASTECVMCPGGFVSVAMGQGYAPPYFCTACRKGQYGAPGQAGQYYNGRNDCTNCPSGYFSEHTNSTECVMCPGGFVSVDMGQGYAPPYYCTACPVGQYSAPGQAAQYSNAQIHCRNDCPPGTIQVEPNMCTTSQPTKSPTTSQPTKAPTTSQPTKSPTTSQPTKSPTHSPTKAPTLSPTHSPTHFPTSSPTRSPCKKGCYHSTLTTEGTCETCGAGRYADAEGALACTRCPVGFHQAANAESCEEEKREDLYYVAGTFFSSAVLLAWVVSFLCSWAKGTKVVPARAKQTEHEHNELIQSERVFRLKI